MVSADPGPGDFLNSDETTHHPPGTEPLFSRNPMSFLSSVRPTARTRFAALLFLASALAPGFAQPAPPTDAELAPAPLGYRDPATADAIDATGAARPESAPQPAALTVDRKNRASVVSFYKNTYLPGNNQVSGWNGTIATCNEGATFTSWKAAVLQRINYYRAMAGVSSNLSFTKSREYVCARAALMSSANNTLSHDPPATWNCFTGDGYEGCSNSNLAIGRAGAEAIDLYMIDSGSGNTAVGHRRWILYSAQKTIATGDVTPAFTGANPYRRANALWVLGPFAAAVSPAPEIAWPNAGYFPFPLLPARWSFGYPNADFRNATVLMTRNGANVSLTLEPLDHAGGVTDGTFLGDNTLVWVPQGLPTSAPATDLTYRVEIRNVIVGGKSRTFTYDVTLIDPSIELPTPTPTPTVSPSVSPSATPSPSPSPSPSVTPSPSPSPSPSPIPEIQVVVDPMMGREAAESGDDRNGDDVLDCADAVFAAPR